MTLSAIEQANLAVVQGYFSSFVDGTLFTYLENNFQPDIEYVILNRTSGILNNPADYSDDKFTHERQFAAPHSGVANSIPAVQAYFSELLREVEVREFNTRKFVVDGNNVTVFGDFFFVGRDTGNQAEVIPLAVDIEVSDSDPDPNVYVPKFQNYLFFEDTFSFSSISRQGVSWRRYWDGEWQNIFFGLTDSETITGNETESNIIYGYQGNDTLTSGTNHDIIWGGSGDDIINGGEGNDTLYGNTGNDTLTGGDGADNFGIGLDQGFNTITDFVQGTDFLGLIGTLTFADVSFSIVGSDLQISTNSTSLAILNGASGLTLTAADFQEIPNTDRTPIPEPEVPGDSIADEAINLDVVQGFFNSFSGDINTLFDYIDTNFDEDIRYTFITPTLGANNPSDYADDKFAHELQVLLPFIGLKIGKEQVKESLADLFSEFEVEEFVVDKYVVEDNSIAVHGGLSLINKETGNKAALQADNIEQLLPFTVDIRLENGQIAEYKFYVDSYALAAAARQGGAWRRIWDGEWTTMVFGTKEGDNLIGIQDEKNVLFGYQNDDHVMGGHEDDVIYGGSGNDTINGGLGNDNLYGNEDSDTFVLTTGQGTDTIYDFVVGQDQISLLDDLSFDQLTLTAIEGDLEVKVTNTQEVLAILTGVESLTSADVIAQSEDLVFGTPGNDDLFAPIDLDGRRDIVFVGAGDDKVDVSLSTVGRNRIFGGSGVDTIYVSTNDRVFGGSGDDEFEATDGQGGNRMSGGAGDDIFFLGYGDRALGGEGNDEFYVGTGGNNLIAGGVGADQFWLVNAELPDAANTILDLELGMDTIGIGGYVQADLSFGTDGLGNATLAVQGTNVASFMGITQAQLETANFAFM
ncbi:hypothetical protein WJM97_09270 [Okeanomitos corallinicola TIOX110]|uniref:Calcium-binding protein n=1 Tax=Okeanomitos corallinicola TIOX110 TaxID=3133117 RepID=A0ABZ2UXR5_9CYAN